MDASIDRAHGLPPGAIEVYARDGIVFPLDGVAPARARDLRRAVETVGGGAEPLRLCHLWFGWAFDLVLEPRLLGYVEALLGPEVIAWGSIVLRKPPFHPGYVSWHQDSAYPGRDGAPAVSVWVALTDSTPENGCMRVVPGSHGALLPHQDTTDPDNLLRAGRSIASAIETANAVDVTLRAGEVSLHHGRLVHGSNPNRSAEPRIGFVVRYATPAMADPGFPVVLARGSISAHPHLTFARRPVETAETLARYERANVARAATA